MTSMSASTSTWNCLSPAAFAPPALIATLILTSLHSSCAISISSRVFLHQNDSSSLHFRSFFLAAETVNQVEQRTRNRRDAEALKSEDQRIACYSCTHITDKDHSTETGCNDPFDSTAIPEVMCNGACHKLMTVLQNGASMVVRGCMSECRETVDEYGYNKCCQTKLCNRSASLNDVTTKAIYAFLSVLLSFAVSLQLNRSA